MTNVKLVEMLTELNKKGVRIWMSEDGWKMFARILNDGVGIENKEGNVG